MSKSTYLSMITTHSFFFFFFLLISTCHRYSSSLETKDSDYEALEAFKSRLLLQPADNILSRNWTSTTHFCNWYGVSCFNRTFITSLRLPGLALRGQLSPHIANMTHLVELDLSANNLTGSVPSELGSLKHLRILNLTKNSFQGDIPPNLSLCHKLQQLDISYNFISGSIPGELGLLGNLRHLNVSHNNLTGRIPPSLGNFSRLEHFYLQKNDLLGEIPEELGMLTSLTVLFLRGNNLTGSIPPSIFNISSLQEVDLSMNRLSGPLPESLGNRMPNLETLFLDSNRISGKIPVFLSNASKLSYLALTENDMNGEIPENFGSLQSLVWFEFEYNQISGGIPYGLFNITSLQALATRHNYLGGNLPHDIGNWLPNLQYFFLSHNQFSGEIPSSICNATKLVCLEVSNNSFSGPVPMLLGNLIELEQLFLHFNLLVNNPLSTHLDFIDSMVHCRKLQYLFLDSNPLNGILSDSVGNLSSNLKVFTAASCGLKGRIPSGFGNLSTLNYLGLSSNNLQGELPVSFGALQNLEGIYLSANQLHGNIPAQFCQINILGILDLGENRFSGSIPVCIRNLTELTEISLAANSLNSVVPHSFWDLVNLQTFNLSKNRLQGNIPMELSNLKGADIMDLSSNNFSGEIPDSIGSLQSLRTIDMSQNNFQGPMPSTLSSLIVIEHLDLSSNRLSGNIPASLGSLRDLVYLNLSYNMLQGEVPHTGIFTYISSQFLIGNPKLCSVSNLNFSLCSSQTSRQRKIRTSLVLKISIPIASTFLVLVTGILVWICFSRRKHVIKNVNQANSLDVGHRIITYHELLRATEGFSESKLLGRGSSGMVYKAGISDGTLAAVKVFNMQYAGALKNFTAECKVLSSVRHRNLVKVITACSNLEFKAMVLEFMPNGSLDHWLHSNGNSLSLVQRLDIVTDVAMALEYLHYEYTVPIVHCDLKPSNVLLDEDMTARVADFGIAKILAQDQEFIRTKTLGTIGYIAPEYGLDGQVSTRGDVYSFGILLLETFTGKRPTDDMFTQVLSLHQWVKSLSPGSLIDVVDPSLIYDIGSVEDGRGTPTQMTKYRVEEVVDSVIRVALLCLKELPEERIDMRETVVQVKKIRDEVRKSYGN